MSPLLPPHPPAHPLSGRNFRRLAVQVMLINTIIAGTLATIQGSPFGRTLVYSQCIGLGIWGLVEIGRRILPTGENAWPVGWHGLAMVAVACVAGYFGGVAIADTIFGFSRWRLYAAQPGVLLRDLGPTVVFCSLIVAWFGMLAKGRAHRERAAAKEHEATLARLTLLQSQLEPHMLFNTLANLRALISADPARAQEMLDRLIDFLRATLVASRVASHPLSTEFERLDDYLALMRIRMGTRLDATTELPPELAPLTMPPLLLQPLVENAIKHGLEPQRGPGTLRVRATREGSTLLLSVVDSGRGLDAAREAAAAEPGSRGTSFGVAQVRERLQTVYGDAASLVLAPAEPRGTRAEIRIPLHDSPFATSNP